MLHPYCGEHEKSWDEVKFAPPGPDGPLGAYAPCVRGGCVNGHSHLLGDPRMAWLRLLKVENPSGMLREPVGNSFDHPYRSLVTSSFGAIGPPLGPGLHFPKSFRKSHAPVGKEKFPEIVRSWPGSRNDTEEIFQKSLRSKSVRNLPVEDT